MTIRAIREDNTIEEVNPDHVARVWEEGEFTVYENDEHGMQPGTHPYTNLMFSCGLVVKYKAFVQQTVDKKN